MGANIRTKFGKSPPESVDDHLANLGCKKGRKEIYTFSKTVTKHQAPKLSEVSVIG